MATRRFEEIDVERINLVDPNGTLRLAIHNRERIPDPGVDGVTFKRQGNPASGFIFFNDEGDECGGFLWSGSTTESGHRAGHHLSFDQYKQDQVLTLSHGEEDGRTGALLNIQDRAPGVSLADIVRDFEDARHMEDGEEKTNRLKELDGKYWVYTRVVFGRGADGESILALNDSKGRRRIVLSVDSTDTPTFKFLDEEGKVTLSLPPE
jgi:hypothetical protein